MIKEFKTSMIQEFNMTDIELMAYFLGIQVKQSGKEYLFLKAVMPKRSRRRMAWRIVIELTNQLQHPASCQSLMMEKV